MRLTAAAGSLLLLGLWLQGASAATVYVSTAKAQLRQAKGVSARIVASVKRGQALQVLRQDGRWYYVATRQGHKGWLYRYRVTTTQPQRSGNLTALLGRSSSRASLAESSSASGIRGLNPASERQARRRGNRSGAIRAVKQMEQLSPSAKELQRFLRDGKLGEYYEGS